APFVVLSALLPAASAWIAWRLWRRRDHALVAGLLTLFASAYFVRWVTPETFSPFALALFVACVASWCGTEATTSSGAITSWLVAGVGAGIAPLTRGDGGLVLVVVVWIAMTARGSARARILAAALAAGGYLAVMMPWFARSMEVFHTPLPTAGSKAIWL